MFSKLKLTPTPIHNTVNSLKRPVRESFQYQGARKMGKGRDFKAEEVSADFEKFEKYYYEDSIVSGIITTIADSMSEAGLLFK